MADGLENLNVRTVLLFYYCKLLCAAINNLGSKEANLWITAEFSGKVKSMFHLLSEGLMETGPY